VETLTQSQEGKTFIASEGNEGRVKTPDYGRRTSVCINFTSLCVRSPLYTFPSSAGVYKWSTSLTGGDEPTEQVENGNTSGSVNRGADRKKTHVKTRGN